MVSASYPDSSREVAHLQAAGPPPFIPEMLRGETRIAGRWSYAPFRVQSIVAPTGLPLRFA